jgi:hypothetical protein
VGVANDFGRRVGDVFTGNTLFSPDGRIMFATAGRRDVIAMDVEKGTPLARSRAGNWPDGMGWAPKPLR